MRPFVESFIGTSLSNEEAYGFDLEDLIKIPCLLNFVHLEKGDKVFANIKSATPLPKGMEAPAPVNEHSIINVDTSYFDEIEKLPDFLKVKIKSSEEYQARVGGVVQERLGNNTEADPAGAQPAKPIRPKMWAAQPRMRASIRRRKSTPRTFRSNTVRRNQARSPDASRGFLLAGCASFVNSTANQQRRQRVRCETERRRPNLRSTTDGGCMLHTMTLVMLILTISATIAMRRVEEDIIKRYPPDKRQPDNMG